MLRPDALLSRSIPFREWEDGGIAAGQKRKAPAEIVCVLLGVDLFDCRRRCCLLAGNEAGDLRARGLRRHGLAPPHQLLELHVVEAAGGFLLDLE